MSDTFARISDKFDLLYSKRAFVHWFVGYGQEDSMFDCAIEDIRMLEDEYRKYGVVPHVVDEDDE